MVKWPPRIVAAALMSCLVMAPSGILPLRATPVVTPHFSDQALAPYLFSQPLLSRLFSHGKAGFGRQWQLFISPAVQWAGNGVALGGPMMMRGYAAGGARRSPRFALPELPFSRTLALGGPWKNIPQRNSMAVRDAHAIWALYMENQNDFVEQGEIATIRGPAQSANGDLPLLTYTVLVVHEIAAIAAQEGKRIKVYDLRDDGRLLDYTPDTAKRDGPIHLELTVHQHHNDNWEMPSTAVMQAKTLKIHPFDNVHSIRLSRVPA